ncbi:S8 family peptidase [Actinomadura miaoliensis]|uniref:Peptidase S8/S53 domain-containing protein n=1 Tax=Actinomadura miaoliensis TaxID=430685 RepID=A0ABP7W1Z5_9ACTN
MRGRRIGRALLGAAVVGGVVAAPPGVADAAKPPAGAGGDGGTGGAAGASGALPAGRSWTVTLLTGDVVRLRTVKGRPPMVTTTPGEGRTNRTFRTSYRPDGHVVVTPADMAPLVGRVLDLDLFDVTTLIRQGYDDARARELPLIVQREGGVRPRAALGGTLRETRDLPSIGAVAARQPKKDAVRLGASLAPRTRTKAANDIRRIWLDRKVRASSAPSAPALAPGAARAASAAKLDRNLSQIGAPAAWQAGITGRGTKVAVLDTGVDPAHPDLKDRVAETANFSEAADAADRVGHGTHVASIVAGSGAASGGERRGVAPDASLLVGKVLDDDGFGTESSVIAGMEWAAPRAKVVNMSLGGDTTDGTDPLAQALDRLTDQYGALFVTAAGNAGAISSIGSPGSADAALTVGAVDGRDRLADFSSRGPRTGRYAAKPEIVAPGVDIMAARAAGTSMGDALDARYTSASGTSMATPHVAGAAALLLQKHPKWTPAQLKSALVGSASSVDGDAFDRGAGRLDVAAATTAPTVSLQAAPHLGTSAYPGHAPLKTDLRWASRSASTVRLDLDVRVTDRQGNTVDGAASLSSAQVDVPAGGGASATLRVDAAKLGGKPGLYTAEVTAKADDATVRTPVTFYVEPPSYDLTVKATPLPGTQDGNMSAYASVVNLDDIALFTDYPSTGEDGTARLRVPAGRYSVMGSVYDDNREAPRSAIAGTPEVVIDRDTTVVLDAARAKEAGAKVSDRTTETAMAGSVQVRSNRQAVWGEAVYTWEPQKEKVYVQPTGPAQTGEFRPYGLYRLTAPGEVYDLLEPMGDRVPDDPVHVVTPASRARLARVDQRFAAFDGDTQTPMSEKRYGVTPEGFLSFEASSGVTPGTTRTDYVSAGRGVQWLDEAFFDALNGWVDQLPLLRREPGSRTTQTWGRQPLRPGPVSVTAVSPSECIRWPVARTRGALNVAFVDLQARPDGFDCGYWDENDNDPLTRHLTVTADGRKIGEAAGPAGRFEVPARAATYEIRYDNDASKLTAVSTRTSTTWRFRSAAPEDHSSVPVPLLTVDYDLGLDLRNRPTGGPATFQVARVAGSGTAKVTGLRLWTSLDDGKTWQQAQVKDLGGGKFSGTMPKAAAGQAVSVRVAAKDAGGSAIDQQIIRAYNVR